MKKVTAVFAALLVLAVVLFAGGEFATRSNITNELKKDNPQATISFGAYPVLLGALQKNIHHVEIDNPSTLEVVTGDNPQVVGDPEAHITIDGLNLENEDAPIATTLHMTTVLPDNFILAQAQLAMKEQMPQPKNATSLEDLAGALFSQLVKITSITSEPAEGTLAVQFTDGAAELHLKPVLEGGHVAFEATNAQLFGVDLPAEATAAITEGLRNSADSFFQGLKVDSFDVTDGGLQVALSGTNVNLAELGQ